MIIHNCIKCDYNEMIPICKNPPMIEKYICPNCGELQYIYHSRINPCTYSKEQVIVNEKDKSVKIIESN